MKEEHNNKDSKWEGGWWSWQPERARCSHRGDSWIFPAHNHTNQNQLQFGRGPGGSWGNNETVLISWVQTDQTEGDKKRREHRKEDCMARIVQATLKKSRRGSVWRTSCVWKCLQRGCRGDILHYPLWNDHSGFPTHSQSSQISGCFPATLHIIFILRQPAQVN